MKNYDIRWNRVMPNRKFFGTSEIWRDNSTGTRDFYIFWIRVYRKDFTHSTWLWE